MMKEKMMRTNRLISLLLMLLAIGLLVYAYIRGQSRTNITGWQPANEQLALALDALSSPSSSHLPASIDEREKGTLPSPRAVTTNEASPDPQPSATTTAPSMPSESTQTLPSKANESSGKLNLNEASQAQLEGLPGIGPSKAKAILDYREKRGGFRSVDELRDIKGIGPKIFDKVSRQVTVS
ncbi:ComEA family DNA-binding protein [Cohnella soli]|uniref:ComEA family DNA-binding protein n=1 Tax=Cohnella soli TaxID=425005 RepID=A0ABW0HVB6_9BACL